MSKIPYKAIIVVEGASDEALIRSFLDCDVVTTNGSEVSRETISFLLEASKSRDIVVLTDPDAPGKRIRDLLDQSIPGLKHAFVRKEKSIKRHKVGVAESSKEEILLALEKVIPSYTNARGSLTMADYLELGLMGGDSSKKKRARLDEKFHLGFGNAKATLKKANALGLSRKDLEEALVDER